MSAITQGRTETFAQHRQAFGSAIDRYPLAFFIDRYLRPGYDPLADDRHLERIARLGESL